MPTAAIARSRFEALHRWRDAPEHVAFLRDYHRHEFHVELGVGETHDERDVEFITLKHWLDRTARNRIPHRSDLSCEAMARLIMAEARKCGWVPLYCSVFEDGENGAVVFQRTTGQPIAGITE